MIARKKAFSLKKYGELYKFTVYSLSDRNNNIIPSEWAEEYFKRPWPGHAYDLPPPELPADEKLDNNLSRAKNKVFDYAMSNSWDYFCTFTISPKKYDRYNLHGWYKDFSKWLNNFNGRNNVKLSYLFIPELHKDKAWHIHGFISGLPGNFLTPFTPGVHPQYLIVNSYLDWPEYSKRFGFCSLAPIRKKTAAAAYIMKYIGKGLGERKKELGAHLYYVSRGLKTAESIISGEIFRTEYERITFAFENDYVQCLYLTEEELRSNEKIMEVIGGLPDEV